LRHLKTFLKTKKKRPNPRLSSQGRRQFRLCENKARRLRGDQKKKARREREKRSNKAGWEQTQRGETAQHITDHCVVD
jgi:hypothetical protein